MQLKEITFEEFKNKMLDSYNELFPEDERKELSTIKRCYDLGVEKIYGIVVDNTYVGFIMAEKLGDSYPYYGDYFAIFKKYQNRGYGSESFKLFLDNVVNDGCLIGEIEQLDKGIDEKDNSNRLRRYNFYKQFDIKTSKTREYLLFNVLYIPVYFSTYEIDDEKLDKFFIDYYIFNINNQKIFNENVKIIINENKVK